MSSFLRPPPPRVIKCQHMVNPSPLKSADVLYGWSLRPSDQSSVCSYCVTDLSNFRGASKDFSILFLQQLPLYISVPIQKYVNSCSAFNQNSSFNIFCVLNCIHVRFFLESAKNACHMWTFDKGTKTSFAKLPDQTGFIAYCLTY